MAGREGVAGRSLKAPTLRGRRGDALGSGCCSRPDLGLRSSVCSCKERAIPQHPGTEQAPVCHHCKSEQTLGVTWVYDREA